MKVVLDEGAFPPIRVHDTDAGLDLRAMHPAMVAAHGCFTICTGTHVEIPHGCCGLLVSKSGLNVKLYNHSDIDYWVNAGDKISQLVILPCRYEPVEIVDSFDTQTERGCAGFGSTGR